MLRKGLISAKAVNNLHYKLTSTLQELKLDTVLFLIITPIIAIYGVFTTQFVWKTWLVVLISSQLGMIGMTTLYHRGYSHRTFKCRSRIVEVFLLACATSGFSMSAFDWVKDHRIHHRYTDTDKDPYNIQNGFWYAHVGWLVWKRPQRESDISDIEHDPLLQFQHVWFNTLAFITGWGIPAAICGLFWGDWRGGFFIAAVLKSVIVHHCVFSINSLAHYLGDEPFSDVSSAKDNLLCAILTLGEGYHNFHHEFPDDYRNGVHWSAYDPTKWLIASLEFFGLVTDVHRTPTEMIKLSKLQMIERQIEKEKKGIYTGKPLNELPYYTKEEVAELCSKKGEKLVIEGDIIYDVTEFAPKHPGGSKLIMNNIGRDITRSFNGGVYTHSNAAKNVLQLLRCGRLATPQQQQQHQG